MLIAQVAATLTIGMPFPGDRPQEEFLVSQVPITAGNLRSVRDAAAGNRVWLINDKGYATRSWPGGVSPDEILAWRSGSSLPAAFIAPDPRKTVVPLPKLSAAHSWLDMFAAGIRIAQSTKLDGSGQRGLLILFLSSQGPADHLYSERLSSAAEAAEKAKIGVIGLFPGKFETKASIARFVLSRAIGFPCGLDAGNAYADAFRASRTPEAFLLDDKLRVVYAGAINSNTFGSEDTTTYLLNAISDLASGVKVRLPATRVFGTPIER